MLLIKISFNRLKYASDMMAHCIVGENADTSVIEEDTGIVEIPVVSNGFPLIPCQHIPQLLP